MKRLGLFVKNEEIYRELEQIRRLRNDVVYGVRIFESEDVLYQAGEMLENLLGRMRSESSEKTQQIIDSSDNVGARIAKVPLCEGFTSATIVGPCTFTISAKLKN
jgi:hypothetical protein